MRFSGWICGAIMCLSAGLARAEDPWAGDWHLDLTSYIWMPSLSGNLTVLGRESPVNLSFIDILQEKSSLIGIEGRLGVRKGRIGVYIDGLYNKIGIDNISGPLGFAKANANMTLTFVESAVYYDL